MSKMIAILQSNYLPWKGYFDLIDSVDEFVLLDSVQFTKNDWRNRNRIKTPNGAAWLTIPIQRAGKFGQRIDEAEVADQRWARRHWRTLAQNYARAPYFRRYADELEHAYLEAACETHLSTINRRFLDLVCCWLGIGTRITSSDHLRETPRADIRAACSTDHDARVERLIKICHLTRATHYVTGPRARGYLDTRQFEAAGIKVTFFDYSGYPEYPQRHPPFVHQVSALDMVLNMGPGSASLRWNARVHEASCR